MEKVDITIIGAGVVGLAIAAEVADDTREIVVLERHETFGQETSSRNSEVIHAGIYYPKDSLKAKLCVEGKQLLYQVCHRHGIPCQQTGKLIVALNEEEVKGLEMLLAKGEQNGINDLRMLSTNEVKKMEPHIQAKAALYSPSTGIIDTHSLMKYFESAAKDKGAALAYECEVKSIEQCAQGYEVGVQDADGEAFSFLSRVVINSAGLHADKIAALAGIDIDAAGYRIHYCKGEYFKVGGGRHKLVHHLIYPSPTAISLGIHTVLDLQGMMKLGPNAFYVEEIDYQVEERHKKDFLESIKPILPFVEEDDLSPDMAGIRPKLQASGEEVRDFIIKHEESSGLPGLINLVGIESPGLTSAPAIAKYVGKIAGKYLGP
ncbi:MAG: NAD(P)/FAD-dependent oxidoreductase [bacterium]|nr:NAD(P)/FAD-dependent oxidoreductase [bacterium]